ncbi:RlmI/RlmK family 23S rRNA methyltransferase [Ectothiorhodospira shaposhnikovii]|uniref:class I SAM-dependent rRNA methyltransferase n=1 Tax=Ectothiorhodospira shaposhnikovii TaxID=1054 RepID=UPI00190809B8|nr:class I SAM-dependent rRNA methyltransferase [Ectothiorhodospira shaposhnikovii]MBK1673378.1 RlmI/RlmK family 23S rRNA methyltransferase [Ectothiorhodospira shaposhnikovii]
METLDYVPLRLKKNEERRLLAGHAWIFSNEVDVEATPIRSLEPGQPVTIQDSRGRTLGTGYANPNSLICARLVTRDADHPFGPSLLVHRLKVALSLRERLFEEPFYRLVHGESDGLPGLVVDRYGDVLVAQITTAGMDRLQDALLSAFEKVLRPSAVLWRNDSPVRSLEGLDLYVQPATGPIPETVEITENGARFQVPLLAGQKTGWFYDQRDNRAWLRRLSTGARVLDLFSYAGGWGIQAAIHGAEQVTCVDASADAVAQVEANARLNRVDDRVQALAGDAFEVLRQLREERARFDLIIVDPPAFIKRRKDLKEGTAAYRRINQMALQVLARDGFLITCSCSQHMAADALEKQVHAAARHVDRQMQILSRGGQASDHPIHPAMPETAYLKAILCRCIGQ